MIVICCLRFQRLDKCLQTSLNRPQRQSPRLDLQEQAGYVSFIESLFQVGVVKGMGVTEFEKKKYDPLGVRLFHSLEQVRSPIKAGVVFTRAGYLSDQAVSQRFDRVSCHRNICGKI